MPISTPLTARLGIQHPILSAPMDVIAGARLTAAVSAAGGFGILGGGYGDEAWLEQETAKLADVQNPFGIGFITWSLAKQPALLDIALQARPRAIMLSFGDPKPFAPRIKSVRRAADLPGADRGHGAAGAGCRRRHPDRAGHGSGRPRRLAHHARHRAGDRRSRGRPGAGRRRRRHRRRPRAGGDDDAGRVRRAARHALLCQPGMRRRRRKPNGGSAPPRAATASAASSSISRATMSGRRRSPAAA